MLTVLKDMGLSLSSRTNPTVVKGKVLSLSNNLNPLTVLKDKALNLSSKTNLPGRMLNASDKKSDVSGRSGVSDKIDSPDDIHSHLNCLHHMHSHHYQANIQHRFRFLYTIYS